MIWISVSVTYGECYKINGETSLITNFIQRFIQPYIQSLQLAADDVPVQRSSNESPVKKAIREVIEDLRPLLQDEDKENANNVQLGGSSETTIIEFLPKPNRSMLRTGKEPSSELQTSIHKYEKIKSEIKAALQSELVAEKTKKMVTRTLDELIAQVIGNQCTWKSVDHSLAVFRNGKDAKHNITLAEWEDLKSQYLNFLQRKHLHKSLALFNDFHNFFSKVINDTNALSTKYKIKCQLIKVGGDSKTPLSQETGRAQDNCEEFKICSEELKYFLLDFYKSLNDTTVSVFKNYAAMYVRDVVTDTDDTKEIDSVPSVLENMGNAVDRRVSKVFIQELTKIKLDENKNKETNIKILREFIRTTCKRVQKHVKKHLASDLVSLRARLLLTVKQDINMNLGVDLGNLEADIKGRICTVFVTCNGGVSENRRTIYESGTPGVKSNSVYVKVQLTLDDRLKDVMVRSNRDLFRSLQNKYQNNQQRVLKKEYHMDFRKYDNLNVTRTTVEIESSTKNINSNVSYVNNILNNSVFELF